MSRVCTYMDSPFGQINLVVEDGFLVYVKRTLSSSKSELETSCHDVCDADNKILDRAKFQLSEYFNGRLKEFDLPYKLIGTDFQKSVWEYLLKIPYGETRTYKDVAIAIDNPKACRAVGMANNKNPLTILVPCHRVIGSNGKLTGYFGGVEMKAGLLDMERI